jgi:carbonic anhydrase
VHPGDASAASVMYYAIHALGVRHVVIAGHTACGGAAACAAAAKAGSSGVVPDAGGETAAINQWLAPMVKLVGTLGSSPSAYLLGYLYFPRRRLMVGIPGLDEIVVANVKQQVKNAADSEPVKAAWAKGLDVHVHGWVYHLDKGTIEDLGVSVAPQKA